MHRIAFVLLALTAASTIAHSGECEDKFRKSGSPLSGTDFSSRITVPDLSVAGALGQLRAIMISEKMDVITEDLDGGTLLVEQRSTGATRPIPTLINVAASGTAATIDMIVKTEKGMLARQGAIRPYLCELARDAKGNALAVTARYRGRSFSLKGRVDYIQEDDEDYNVSFEIPEQRDLALQVPGDREPRVGVACLFRPAQLANVLTFRKGQNATFTGTFYRYDDIKRMAWLENCRQTAR